MCMLSTVKSSNIFRSFQLDNVRGIVVPETSCRGHSCIFDASVGTLAEDADVSPMHRNEVCNGVEREPVGPIPLN